MRIGPLVLAGSLLVAGAARGQAIGNLGRDIKELQALVQSDSNDAQLQYYLALAHWKRHHWQQTDSLLRLAVRLEPRYAEAYLALYYLPYARRSTLIDEELRGRVPESWKPVVAEAQRFYQRAFRTDPLVSLRVMSVVFEIREPSFNDYTSPAYREYELYYAWFVDLGLGRYASAHDRLQALAQREFDESKHPERVPDFILWYRGLAAAHGRRYEAAIADFRTLLDRALKQTQRDEIVHVPLRDNEYRFMLAALHHVAGNADSAVNLYQAAIEHDLGLVMAHTYLAAIHEASGRGDDALIERRRAAEASEDDPTSLFELGVALFNAGQVAEAEEPLKRAIALNERYAPPYYLLGRVAEESDRKAEAREHYRRFLDRASRRLQDLIIDAQQRLEALSR